MKDRIVEKLEGMNIIGKVMICAGTAVAIVLIPVLVFLGHHDKAWKWRKKPDVTEETIEV